MSDVPENIANKRQRLNYFIQRFFLASLCILIIFSRSINNLFFNSQYSKDEIFYFTLIGMASVFIWAFFLDRKKKALGITEFIFPKKQIVIEKTKDVSENIRRYKIAEQEEIARVIEERKTSSYFQRLLKRLLGEK